MLLAALLVAAPRRAASAGTGPTPELVWGIHGTKPGWLHKPRVAAFDGDDHLYVADLTDRIQVFDRDGKYLRGWRTPDFNVDGPSGLTVDRFGRLLVADTHFYRVLVYSDDGRPAVPARRRGAGDDPGPVRLPDRRGDSTGRATSTSPSTARTTASRSSRPRGSGSASGAATASSPASSSGPGPGHRRAGSPLRRRQLQPPHPGLRHARQAAADLGRAREAPGQMSYPYDLAMGPDGRCTSSSTATAGSRSSRREGKPLGLWGEPGREPGQLFGPWGLAVDSRGPCRSSTRITTASSKSGSDLI